MPNEGCFMRVLQLIPSVAPIRGGPSQAVLEMTAALTGCGVDVEIATTDDCGPTTLAVTREEIVEHKGCAVRFFPRCSFPVRALQEFSFSLPFSRWLWRHVRDYDLVHVHALFSYVPSFGMWVCRKRNVPYICRPSGLLGRWSLAQSRRRKRMFWWLLDRANLNNAAAVEYTSTMEREEAADLEIKAPSFIMPYGIHPPSLRPDSHLEMRRRLGIPAERKVLLFMSRLHPKKGLDLLLRAAGEFRSQLFDIVIAGSGDASYMEHLQRIVNECGLTGRVHFVGFALGDFKNVLLQGSDIFALPSHAESFAIVVLEALCAGTKVLTTPGVPLASLVNVLDAGVICEPTKGSVVQALGSLLVPKDDVTVRRLPLPKRHELISRLCNWDTIAARLAQSYHSVLSQDPVDSYILEEAVSAELISSAI